MDTYIIIKIVAAVIILALYIVGLTKYLRRGSTSSGRRAFIPLLTLGFLLCVYLVFNVLAISPADFAQIVLLFGLVIVTGVYAWSTANQADEVTRQRVNASQAVIWPDVYWRSDSLIHTLYNIGNAPALKVNVRIQNEIIMLFGFISPGDKKEGGWRPDGFPSRPITASGSGDYDKESLKRIAGLVGPYLLVVTWEDLMEQHFEARLLFSLGVNYLGLVSISILEGPTLKPS